MPILMCPNCSVSTQAVQRFDVELDMCPQCRGVWLDRGELEKILDMERVNLASPPLDRPRQVTTRRSDHDRDHAPRPRRDDDHHDSHGRHKKRPSIFDIFD